MSYYIFFITGVLILEMELSSKITSWEAFQLQLGSPVCSPGTAWDESESNSPAH